MLYKQFNGIHFDYIKEKKVLYATFNKNNNLKHLYLFLQYSYDSYVLFYI